ncbi:DUF1152 domain-containing protein [uncultured Thiodictyon sp.]|uniref:DUF1152 domain-containing protein n=1 Tax=uncultured Thiodictyon sp. TaxID=1846217 RepID=UPI0025F71C3B|nr:DUF1152 domain-containing protein [uncultured Thiodictyon sp.]
MELNLPILSHVADCKNLLIAGMGGGFDVFCGLPIYFELRRRGHVVHLAKFSFSDIESITHGIRLSRTLVGVTADPTQIYPYFPEFHLTQWFKERRGEDVPIWSFQKTGARPLLENYRLLAEHLSLDGILLIDGGVDSLMSGDEAEMGTAIEDATSLFAVHELRQVPVRLLACVGFGAEQDITYTHVLENIAALTREGGAFGSCSLLPQMESYQAFEEAVLYAQDQPCQDPSVINSCIVSAVRGHYGDYHLTDKTKGHRLWISPLMTQYWFFDCQAVASRNRFLSCLTNTVTFREALFLVMEATQLLAKRKASKIPL